MTFQFPYLGNQKNEQSDLGSSPSLRWNAILFDCTDLSLSWRKLWRGCRREIRQEVFVQNLGLNMLDYPDKIADRV